MSKRLLALILFFMILFPLSIQAKSVYETEWQRSSCYSGIEFKLVVYEPDRGSSNQLARLFIRNRYQEAVSVSYKFDVNGKTADGRTNTISPREEVSGGAWTLIPISNYFSGSATISKLQVRGSNSYRSCD